MAGTRLRRLEPFGRGYLALRHSRLASSAALVGTAVAASPAGAGVGTDFLALAGRLEPQNAMSAAVLTGLVIFSTTTALLHLRVTQLHGTLGDFRIGHCNGELAHDDFLSLWVVIAQPNSVAVARSRSAGIAVTRFSETIAYSLKVVTQPAFSRSPRQE